MDYIFVLSHIVVYIFSELLYLFPVLIPVISDKCVKGSEASTHGFDGIFHGHKSSKQDCILHIVDVIIGLGKLCVSLLYLVLRYISPQHGFCLIELYRLNYDIVEARCEYLLSGCLDRVGGQRNDRHLLVLLTVKISHLPDGIQSIHDRHNGVDKYHIVILHHDLIKCIKSRCGCVARQTICIKYGLLHL